MNGVHIMKVSYKKLWVLLTERELKKKDLCELAHVSQSVVTKLGKGESVTTVVLARICQALHCNIGDIMDVILTEEGSKISPKI